jgi:hypothetical protein
MKPIEFKEQNLVLKKPENMTDEECGSLPVFKDYEKFISKWKLSEGEKKFVMEHGYIYIVVFGTTHPPILAAAGELVVEKVKLVKEEK